MKIKTEHLTYDHVLFESPHNQKETFMMHSHNSFEMIFFEKGDAVYVIEDKKYNLRKNDLIIIRPRKYHYIEIGENSEYSRYNLSFDSSAISGKLTKKLPDYIEVINCPKGSIINDIFKRLDYYNMSLNESEFCDILLGSIKEIIYNISLLSTNDIINRPAEISPILTEGLKYIRENLFTVKDIKEISDHCFVTEQYFYRLFKLQLKTTPKKYINTKRMLYAQRSIRQGNSPTAVYCECGFESYVGFYKQYLKTFGHSPSDEKLFRIV